MEWETRSDPPSVPPAPSLRPRGFIHADPAGTNRDPLVWDPTFTVTRGYQCPQCHRVWRWNDGCVLSVIASQLRYLPSPCTITDIVNATIRAPRPLNRILCSCGGSLNNPSPVMSALHCPSVLPLSLNLSAPGLLNLNNLQDAFLISGTSCKYRLHAIIYFRGHLNSRQELVGHYTSEFLVHNVSYFYDDTDSGRAVRVGTRLERCFVMATCRFNTSPFVCL